MSIASNITQVGMKKRITIKRSHSSRI